MSEKEISQLKFEAWRSIALQGIIILAIFTGIITPISIMAFTTLDCTKFENNTTGFLACKDFQRNNLLYMIIFPVTTIVMYIIYLYTKRKWTR